jgi:hypothetical protein
MNRCAHRSSRIRHTFGFVLLPVALLTAALAQNNQPPRSPDPPVLIWDIDLKFANDVPRNFRTTNDRPNESSGKITVATGLSDLRASGSGEFSLKGLKALLPQKQGPVTVFDLRQETPIRQRRASELVCVTRLGQRRTNTGRHREAGSTASAVI